MKKRRKQEDAPTELRRRAEKALEERLAVEPAVELSGEDATRVIHELQVHQIELDMQNEELRRAQEELAIAHERYLNLYDFAPVGYVTLSVEGKIQEANFTCADMLGVERRMLVGKSLAQFFAWEDRDLIFLHYRQVFESGVCQSCDVRVRKEDPVRYIQRGKEQNSALHIRLDSVVEKQKEGAPGLCRTALMDITEPKRLEKELVRLERLRALGEMSAGVSHNLNNMLTGILGPAQLLLRYSEDAQVQADVKIILKSAERARDLVRRLHQSVRGEEGQGVQPVVVEAVVSQAVNDTRPRWKDEAEVQGIVIRVEQDVVKALEISGTVSGLYDLLVNLLLNAVDAMPGGGIVSILAKAEDADVVLIVQDTGIGMNDEVRKRVFEPFFTTKMNVGTGLGLSTVHRTVEQWGGRIGVESAPGAGATFTLWLPIWKKEASHKVLQEPVSISNRRGKVLVVDDDEDVGKLLKRTLSGAHDVEVFQSGSEVFTQFEKDRYDVALVDLGLLDVPGNRLADELRRRDPELVVVLITGWELQDEDPRRSAFDYYLRKPFEDIDKVSCVVAQAVSLHDQRASERR